jgi:hypothetical protein
MQCPSPSELLWRFSTRADGNLSATRRQIRSSHFHEHWEGSDMHMLIQYERGGGLWQVPRSVFFKNSFSATKTEFVTCPPTPGSCHVGIAAYDETSPTIFALRDLAEGKKA